MASRIHRQGEKVMSKQTIGIVGYGFVGQAVAAGLCPVADVTVYDKDPELGLFKVEECKEGLSETMTTEMEVAISAYQFLVNHCHIIFVCVPTPMLKDGGCDTSIVENVVIMLNAPAVVLAVRPTIVIKSTVTPGTTAKLQEKCQWVNLVFNPEFLTEANSQRDFAEQDRVILGGVGLNVADGVEEVATLYREFGLARRVLSIHSDILEMPIIQSCTSTEAEMVKYLVNCFLATKVSLANEFSQLCEKVDADWDEVWRLASKDERLGTSHWQVPGPDGKPGFGGSCFPKDLFGMVKFMVENSVDPHTLLGAWDTNIKVRPERDWEELKGRAVQ